MQTAASHTRVQDPYDDYADYPGGGAVAGASEFQSSGSAGGLYMSENDREKVYAELKRLLDRREVHVCACEGVHAQTCGLCECMHPWPRIFPPFAIKLADSR